MKKFALTAAFAAIAASAVAVPGSVITENDKKTGDVVYMPGQKVYVVTLKKGNMKTEVPLASVRELDIEKPANFEALADKVRKGQGAQAIAGLTQIMQTYKMLQWDKLACRYLVEAYVAANQVQKAYDTASQLISTDKSAAYKGDLAPAYWQTLLKLGKNQQLENCLRMASSNGDRASSAEALIMRGDIIAAGGSENPEAYRKALTDAYLRVGLMYNDPPCRQARRTALLRCADCFRQIGMDLRAESMESLARSL